MKLFSVCAVAFSALLAGTIVTEAASLKVPSTLIVGVPAIPFRDLGHAPSVPVRLALVLRYRSESEMNALIAEQPNLLPSHQVFSARQFRDYFSPSEADYQRTAGTLTAMGFQIERTYSDRSAIDVESSAAVVDRVFDTEIHAVVQPAIAPAYGRAGIPGGLRYANVRPATVPAELRPIVYGVIGFDNLIVARPMFVTGGRQHLTGMVIGPPLYGPDGGYGPFAFAEGYNFPVQHQIRGGQLGQTYDGKGQATANIIDSDFKDSDLSSFLDYFNIKRTGQATERLLVNGGPHPRFNGDEYEADLDVETIVGTTPGTALYLYLLPDLSEVNIIDGYLQVVSDDAAEAANSSFGGCETEQPAFTVVTDYIASQGVLEGINFSAASGDSGSDDGCVFSPASGPHFIATGGTTLKVDSDGRYESETAWDGSGGGLSTIFLKPAYQNGIRNVLGITRNVPDIAFDANSTTGGSVYMEGQFVGPAGGTSLASPLTTALVTQLDQFNGSRLGDVHAGFYAAFRRLGYRNFQGLPAFRDVIGGNNGMYQCTQGYDLVTGIGSVDGAGAANFFKPL